MRLFILFALVVRGCYLTLLVILRSKKKLGGAIVVAVEVAIGWIVGKAATAEEGEEEAVVVLAVASVEAAAVVSEDVVVEALAKARGTPARDEARVEVGPISWGSRSGDIFTTFCERIERDRGGTVPRPAWVSNPDDSGYAVAHFFRTGNVTAWDNAAAMALAWNDWSPGTHYENTSAHLLD
ncbi:hypothetical protein DFH09DRAFT_1319122 [Mycena vulgaris]|nr:hypothetical protein DFH09DRAFT_1319122 [Mycena vulgaris]